MAKGIAIVAHRVSTDPKYCEHVQPDDTNGWRSQCGCFKLVNRVGREGKRNLPRCTLFGVWLEKEGHDHLRCDACRIATGELEVKRDEPK